MNFSTLKVSQDPRGVLLVTLNRPEVRNAFNAGLIDDLTRIFSQDVFSESIRVVVLKGEGPAFCAGGDLNWMKESVRFSYNENLQGTRKLAQMFSLMNECPKPLIGALHGAAIGGGVGLVSVCDIVIAEVETQFSLSEVRLGIVPACIGPFVIGKIGPSFARALFMSAERIRAPKAKEIGLVHETAVGMEEVNRMVERTLENLLQSGPNAVSVVKKMILDLTWAERRSQLGDSLEYVARLLADIRVTPEAQEGVQAFLEKRKPNWAGLKK